MNEHFQENKGKYLLLLGLLFALLVVCYFIFLRPVTDDTKTKERQLQQTEYDIELLEIELNNERNKDNASDKVERLKLANQLPENPLIDKLIVTLEEIEFVSNSRIERIQFSYGGSAPERSRETQDELNVEAQEDNQNENDLEVETNDEPTFVFEGMPEELQVINITMNVISPNYDDFQTFIQEIERQERMMFVSELNFIHPGEQFLLENSPTDEVSFDLTITTFYYED